MHKAGQVAGQFFPASINITHTVEASIKNALTSLETGVLLNAAGIIYDLTEFVSAIQKEIRRARSVHIKKSPLNQDRFKTLAGVIRKPIVHSSILVELTL